MAKDPEIIAHQQWIGYVQPVGLVVSTPALVQAQAYVNKNIAPDHQRFLACLPEDEKCPPAITDFARFTQDVLGWEPTDLIDFSRDGQDLQSLEVVLPTYNETLRPTHAVREFEPKDPSRPWMMLIQRLPTGQNLDEVTPENDRHWQASPHDRFDRLLRKTEVPFGILFNGTELRLVYAPRGESSGYATFRVKEMAEVAGRPIFAALHMLLSAERLFSLPEKQRLPAILADSRKYQNVVSTQLAEQVLAALYELLRGFQAADSHRHGELLREVLAQDPNHVYGGLLNVLMRLVFALYAEDKDLMSNDPVYANFYSVTGLFERLRADAGRYPDTMDQRYGAWAQLLTLFRMVYEGGRHGSLRIPARKGYLFDPDRYPFLEGRRWKSLYNSDEKLDVPHISDGVIFRILQNLLILDGERLSYRTLDVEQIGSVYEAVMGFLLEVADGRSIAIKPIKSHGAPATINLETLLAVKPADRVKWVAEQTDQKLTGQAAEGIKKADTIEDLLSVLEKKVARKVTPNVVPKGAMVLQPSDERRRSGSHYTPRSLTEPIVRTTLRPILQRFGPQPTPEQILELNVCDPAMGSGAFLVETCRQLGDELVRAWHFHRQVPKLPADEDEILHARRLIAQRCLYGVDRNPMAVDLAKLSLWLATLAKDHPFTFLDHSMRHGDSLVGLTREQIAGFHWTPRQQRELFRNRIEETMKRVTEFRQKILAARDDVPYEHLRQQLDVADEQLSLARLAGDLVIAAYFSAEKDRLREQKLSELAIQLAEYLGPQGKIDHRMPLAKTVGAMETGDKPIHPFHWQIEFPEIFLRENGGFDSIVGNPPFAGKNTLINGNPEGYVDWLKTIHEHSYGTADLVSHFFRRSFNILREKGSFGLIATNSIGQGDTRSTGLRWICTHGGTIYNARKRYRWPGAAAVVVSIVHVCRGKISGPFFLDRNEVPLITAYLFHAGGNSDPAELVANQARSFQGYIVLGMGFTFDDTDNSGASNSLSLMHELIAKDPRNAQCIYPYIGGEEISSSPTHAHHRYVINFSDWPLNRSDMGTMWANAQQKQRDEWERKGTVPTDYPGPVASDWPDLLKIVEEKVKPDRDRQKRDANRERWWRYAEVRPGMMQALQGRDHVLVVPRVGNAFGFVFLDARQVLNDKCIVFPYATISHFTLLQSRLHETWTRFQSTTLKDDLQYTPSLCFETFPFPSCSLNQEAANLVGTFDDELTALASLGREYYEFRAAVMVHNDEGLTKTYNRFHDPAETSHDVFKLRELHAAMDRGVLDAYGWTDLKPTCEFLLDYEEEKEEGENGKISKKKKPWRYRWPDEFRDEVLARLLELNKQRAEEEQLTGQAAETGRDFKKTSNRRTQTKAGHTDQPNLPGL